MPRHQGDSSGGSSVRQTLAVNPKYPKPHVSRRRPNSENGRTKEKGRSSEHEDASHDRRRLRVAPFVGPVSAPICRCLSRREKVADPCARLFRMKFALLRANAMPKAIVVGRKSANFAGRIWRPEGRGGLRPKRCQRHHQRRKQASCPRHLLGSSCSSELGLHLLSRSGPGLSEMGRRMARMRSNW